MTHIYQAPCPDVYRGKYRLTDEQLNNEEAKTAVGKKYSSEVEQIIQQVSLECFRTLSNDRKKRLSFWSSSSLKTVFKILFVCMRKNFFLGHVKKQKNCGLFCWSAAILWWSSTASSPLLFRCSRVIYYLYSQSILPECSTLFKQK